MKISGLQKLTLLDFPGVVACTVFFAGCDLRCPFCHNASLVTHIGTDGGEMGEEEFFSFLSKRKGILEGVAITGGEPLLQPEIKKFICRIRGEGFKVKLDTNGTHPEVLAELLAEGLLDYVAMDIKNSREKYPMTTGVAIDTDKIDRSIRTIIDSGVPHEFRTTVVKEFHEKEDFSAIGKWIKGADGYFLQQFMDSGDLVGDSSKMHAATREEMEVFAAAARESLPRVELRGVKQK